MALTETMENKTQDLVNTACNKFNNSIAKYNTVNSLERFSQDVFNNSYDDLNTFIKENKINHENANLLKNKLYRKLSLEFHSDRIKYINDSRLKNIPFQCLENIHNSSNSSNISNSYNGYNYNGSNGCNHSEDSKVKISPQYKRFLKCFDILGDMISRANRYYYPLESIVYFMYTLIFVGMMLIALFWLAVKILITLPIFYENFLIDKFIFNQFKENLTEACKKLVVQRIRFLYDYDNAVGEPEEELLMFCFNLFFPESKQKNFTFENIKYINFFCAMFVTDIMHLRVVFESFISQIKAPLPNDNLKNTCFAVFKRALQALLLWPVIISIDATLQLIQYINSFLLLSLFLLTMLVFVAVMAVINTPLYVYDALSLLGRKKSSAADEHPLPPDQGSENDYYNRRSEGNYQPA